MNFKQQVNKRIENEIRICLSSDLHSATAHPALEGTTDRDLTSDLISVWEE